MLQLLCYTSGPLKICPKFNADSSLFLYTKKVLVVIVGLVQIYPLLRLLLWLPTMWAQKVDKLDDIKIFNLKRGNIGIEKIANQTSDTSFMIKEHEQV